VPAAGLTARARRVRWRDLELDRYLRRPRVHGPDRGRRLRRGLSCLWRGQRADERNDQLFDVELHRDLDDREHEHGGLDRDDPGDGDGDVVRRLDRHHDPVDRRHRYGAGHRDVDERRGESGVGVLSAEPRGVLTHPRSRRCAERGVLRDRCAGRASDAPGDTPTLGWWTSPRVRESVGS
jgi:hypothetical protein